MEVVALPSQNSLGRPLRLSLPNSQVIRTISGRKAQPSICNRLYQNAFGVMGVSTPSTSRPGHICQFIFGIPVSLLACPR
jgi:hypothetical protein